MHLQPTGLHIHLTYKLTGHVRMHFSDGASGAHQDGVLALKVRDHMPVFVGELRQGAFGDVLANVLQRAEHDVANACLVRAPHCSCDYKCPAVHKISICILHKLGPRPVGQLRQGGPVHLRAPQCSCDYKCPAVLKISICILHKLEPRPVGQLRQDGPVQSTIFEVYTSLAASTALMPHCASASASKPAAK